ncbi:hypothetical protein SAMN02745161_2044 [Halodesulfovibrio marinisediminis DSM 17456]|uniref:Uncharacterized protein n=1 Tax=Halodesulfovibrio marinisediminis DSM 17456 TaxID=1121457 RepID=A0A1N6H749_9BACT|nr:hypothetical protein SAMN02745161_2044 [Halodesulfovibrio marinisediminis DSM 17456]
MSCHLQSKIQRINLLHEKILYTKITLHFQIISREEIVLHTAYHPFFIEINACSPKKHSDLAPYRA